MFTFNCRGRLLVIDRPLVMGIINITPDSFFEGSRSDASQALRQTEKMLQEGADIIDIGAQSSRPAAEWLTDEEELARLRDILPELTKQFPDTFFSIDS